MRRVRARRPAAILGALLVLAGLQVLWAPPAAQAATLHDQMTPYTGAAVGSQDFSNDAFDHEAADDFTVPAGATWSVDGIDVVGFGRASSDFTVRFYSNNASLPGSLLATRMATATGTTVQGRGDLDYALRFAAVDLSTGTYWVSVQAAVVTGNPGWFWSANETSNGNPAVWRQPGDGFATGCTSFATSNDCFDVFFEEDFWTSQLFRIVGSSGPTEVPTTTTLTSAPNPSEFGEAVTFTAIVCATTGTTAPTGSVTFTVDDANAGSVAATPTTAPATGPCAGKASAVATMATSTMPVGTRSIRAAFVPTGSFSTSSATHSHQVARATPTASVLSSQNPSAAGDPVTFTATFCGVNGIRPSGDVAFRTAGETLATVALADGTTSNCGVASFTTATLGAGSHPMTAFYQGDPTYEPHVVSVTQTVNCSGSCVEGTTYPRTVRAGPGESLFIKDAVIKGSIEANDARSIVICGSTIGGSLEIIGSAEFVLIGGDGQGDCAGNTIDGTLTLSENSGGLRVGGNGIGGALKVDDNRASGTDSITGGAAGTVVRGNNVRGPLDCSRNVPAPTNEGAANTVRGPRKGQCIAL